MITVKQIDEKKTTDVALDAITLERTELRTMLEQAAQIGAERAIEDMVCYHYKDACKRLGISYNTLQKRILDGKLHPVDGRITGAELRRYLTHRPYKVGIK